VRDLADALRGFVTVATMLAATAAVYFGARALGERLGDRELGRLVDLAAVLTMVLTVMPLRSWMGTAVDRLVFRRSRQRWAEVHAFLQTLPLEAGVVECCRRALTELARAMQLRGAAMLFGDGEVVAHGALSLAPLERVWPRWSRALPPYTFGWTRLRDLPLPLIEALLEARVIAIVPILSPRRLWGHIVMSTDLLRASFNDEDDQAVDGVAAQLARVLDGAELLARALAVERSLAHAAKLAAIGELAARIAHDIRNPVTAARSLAQQLAAEAASPFAAEHGLILEELERVERLVAALLRFARREEFRFEPVDLGELVRATLEHFRPRLERARIGVEVEAADGLVARADREKMRQVLVNLIENAMDALEDIPDGRRLALAVLATNGTATVRVTDSGTGIAPDALPHLFEPFFSRKAKGTGLGLAIARRTVEAHGGRIAVSRPPRTGTTFDIELPCLEAR